MQAPVESGAQRGRSADDGEKTRLAETTHQLCDLGLAAAEPRRLVGLERAEAGKRVDAGVHDVPSRAAGAPRGRVLRSVGSCRR